MSFIAPTSDSTATPSPRQQVERLIRGWLTSGVYGPGDLLPTASEIARLCDNVSKPTVRRAIKMLAEAGFLQGVPGKGVYVSAERTDFAEDHPMRRDDA
ncbi:MAG: winged helix-turn-helix domain-containing protein [Opitutaceae bacterium]